MGSAPGRAAPLPSGVQNTEMRWGHRELGGLQAPRMLLVHKGTRERVQGEELHLPAADEEPRFVPRRLPAASGSYKLSYTA